MKAPPAGELADATNLVSEQKSDFERLSGVIRQLPGGASAGTYTLDSGGSFKPLGAFCAIETLGLAAADNLERIQGEDGDAVAGMPDGSVVIVRANSASRVVTVKNQVGGSGEIVLATAADFVLNNTKKRLALVRTGTQWVEFDRSYGGDAAAERAFLGLTSAAIVPNPANPGDNGKALLASGGGLVLGTPVSSGGPLHRLLVSRTSDQSVGAADGSSYSHAQFNSITTETSAGNLWDPTTHEIKVPSGVSFVRVAVNLEINFTSAVSGAWWAEAYLFYKASGGGYPANPDGHSKAGLLATSLQGSGTVSAFGGLNAMGGDIAVSSGDRLKLMLRALGAGSIRVRGAALPAYCWLSVEFFA